jgi:hypothetical protein
MSLKKKEYKVDAHAKKAALFFLACKANLATRLSIPAAMRTKGYLDVKAVDRIFAQQVHYCSPKNKVEITLRAETVAVAAMLALSNMMNAMRSFLAKKRPFWWFLLLPWGGR